MQQENISPRTANEVKRPVNFESTLVVMFLNEEPVCGGHTRLREDAI